MMDHIGVIIGYAGALTGVLGSMFFLKRFKRAEVRSKEIGTADQMIELVKKANTEALKVNQELAETNRKECEKLRKIVERLERAVDAVNNCPYRAGCPVADQLQGNKADNDNE